MLTAAELPEGVSLQRVDEWYDKFRFYRHSPSRREIVAWIKQFEPEHVDLATKILDNITLISDIDIQRGYHSALNALDGWSVDPGRRRGRWAFIGLGGQAESGQAMLHMFREANNLTADRHQHLFVTPTELPAMRLTAFDTVVFVDDFSGTGDQFGKRFETFKELVSSEARMRLFLAAATSKAMSVLQDLEDIEIVSTRVLGPSENILSNDNVVFAADEKAAILPYCKKASRVKPEGYGKCGLLLVISRKTPNNSLPILHADNKKWKSIFPRQLQIAPGQ